MRRQSLLACMLVTLVAVSGYLLGHKLHQGAASLAGLRLEPSLLLSAGLMLCLVFVASAIMRQLD
jgi:putative copper export protein